MSPEQTATPESIDRDRIRRTVGSVVDRVLTERAPGPGDPGTGRARWVRWGVESDAPALAGPPPPPALERGRRVVAIGGDHGGFRLKSLLLRYLREELGYAVVDCGAPDENPVDYPDVARDVARAVAGGRAWRGVVVDAMGIGSAMAANKVPGVLCAVCHDAATAVNARAHNDANLLSLGSRVVNPGLARRIVRLFLTTEHEGGRHARRVAKIRSLEAAAAPSPATPAREP